ncbi:Protein SDS23 [Diplonema papillatum]|nr:Protein SDS23 [Diplonema papillatum]|eukprot:gene19088-29383_t
MKVRLKLSKKRPVASLDDAASEEKKPNNVTVAVTVPAGSPKKDPAAGSSNKSTDKAAAGSNSSTDKAAADNSDKSTDKAAADSSDKNTDKAAAGSNNSGNDTAPSTSSAAVKPPLPESDTKRRRLALTKKPPTNPNNLSANNLSPTYTPRLGASVPSSVTMPSPAYGVPNYSGTAAIGMSPSYGMSPGYAMSPMYALSPSRANPKDLGGVLTATITRMLTELSPNGVIEKNTLVASPTETLGELLTRLAAKKVLSAPVVTEEGKYGDMLDVFDILKHIVGMFSQEEIEATRRVKDGFTSSDAYHKMILRGKEFSETKVSKLLESRRQGGDAQVLTTVGPDAKVGTLVTAFLKNRTPDGRTYHRQVLLTSEGHIRALVSQSDILQYIFKHSNVVKSASPNVNTSLAGLGFDKRRVVVVNKNSSVIYALRKMATYNAHSVAVISDDGMLVRHFSASDVRGLVPSDFPNLFSRVEDFGHLRKPLALRKTDTLWDALQLFSTKRLHRACLVDDRFHPFALISIANILEGILRESS